jgi:hypothetical protein
MAARKSLHSYNAGFRLKMSISALVFSVADVAALAREES